MKKKAIGAMLVVIAVACAPVGAFYDWVVAAIMAVATGVPSCASFLFLDRLVAVPDLEIAYDKGQKEIHKPTLTTPLVITRIDANTNKPAQETISDQVKFLRLRVTNKGKGVAKGCQGEIEIVERPKGCPVPTEGPKELKWTEHETNVPINLPPGEEAILDIVLAPKQLRNLDWHGRREWGYLKAWAATNEVHRYGMLLRSHDGFCKGDYVVNVSVKAENAKTVTRKYRLHIGARWGDLDIAPWQERKEERRKTDEASLDGESASSLNHTPLNSTVDVALEGHSSLESSQKPP